MSSRLKRIPSSLGYPFSTAVQAGNILYLSGQIGLDASGKLVPGGVGPETKQTLENIRAVLHGAMTSLDDVIRMEVFLADINDFAEMNKVYATFFKKKRYPARSAVGVSGLALGARVEIECSALVAD